HFMNHDWEYLLILSGDQLYRMDFRNIIAVHTESQADITISTIPVSRSEASSLGIMQMDAERRITRFVEKPKEPALQDSLKLPREWYPRLEIEGDGDLFLASMGIYVFSREVIRRLLDNTLTDFGKHIIPQAIQNMRVFSSVFQGYWEDIGTIRSFFEANLDVTNELPRFNFFDMAAPIFSRPRFLPASKINGAKIDHAVIADGCILNQAVITHSIVGLRSSVGSGTELTRVILLGSDYYESYESILENEKAGVPRIGIGSNCRIENTIVDKNARIGNNVVISPAGKPETVDHANYYIRDGIVIIPKNGVIPHGMVI
ncbi:MAG: glucose-phosphate adenylyltransferase, partial [Verrucomicrobiota bacterium]